MCENKNKKEKLVSSFHFSTLKNKRKSEFVLEKRKANIKVKETKVLFFFFFFFFFFPPTSFFFFLFFF